MVQNTRFTGTVDEGQSVRTLELIVNERNLRIYRASVPTTIPSLGDVYCYLIEYNSQRILVDTGPITYETASIPVLSNVLDKQLQSLSIDLRSIDAIMITHFHLDHWGQLNGLLKRRKGWNPKIYADQDCVNGFSDYDNVMGKWFDRDEEFFRRTGWRYNSTKFNEYKRFKGLAQKVERRVIPILSEGEINGLPGEVIHLYGHDGSQIGLLVEGYLICGDALLEGITPNVFYKYEVDDSRRGLQAYLDTLVKIYNDKRIKKVFGGHGNDISDHKKNIKEMIDFHENRSLEVLNAVNGRNVYETMLEAGILNGRNDFTSHYLALCETYGHIQFLEDNGFVRREEGEIWRFTKIGAEEGVRQRYQKIREMLYDTYRNQL